MRHGKDLLEIIDRSAGELIADEREPLAYCLFHKDRLEQGNQGFTVLHPHRIGGKLFIL